MKRIIIKLQMFILSMFIAPALFTACSDSSVDPTPTPTPGTDTPAAGTYTIMLYGCGGGNLDQYLIYNLNQLTYSDKVKFTGLVKFSQEYQSNAELAGTRQIDMTQEGMKDVQKYNANYRLDDPQHLADFIKDAKQRCPADKYILIFWDHGDTFGVNDQPVQNSYPEEPASTGTRGVIYDDNIKDAKGMSIFEMAEGLKRSDTKLDLIYMDVCLMNTIENLYQIKDYTHYVMGAEHLTPGYGGNYTLLVHSLENHSTLEEALKAYVPSTVNYWKKLDTANSHQDLTVTNMDYIEPVVDVFKAYADKLLQKRQQMEAGSEKDLEFYGYNSLNESYHDAIEYTNKYGVLYNTRCGKNGNGKSNYDGAVDLASACTRIAGNILDGELTALATKLDLALEQMIVASSANNLPSFMSNASIGINWAFKDYYNSENSKYPEATNSMAKVYQLLDFDKKTGWHRFLEQNTFKHIGYVINKQGEVDEIYDMENPKHPWIADLKFKIKTPYVTNLLTKVSSLNLGNMTLKELSECYNQKKNEWIEEAAKEIKAEHEKVGDIIISGSIQVTTRHELTYDEDKAKYPNSYEEEFSYPLAAE